MIDAFNVKVKLSPFFLLPQIPLPGNLYFKLNGGYKIFKLSGDVLDDGVLSRLCSEGGDIFFIEVSDVGLFKSWYLSLRGKNLAEIFQVSSCNEERL